MDEEVIMEYKVMGDIFTESSKEKSVLLNDNSKNLRLNKTSLKFKQHWPLEDKCDRLWIIKMKNCLSVYPYKWAHGRNIRRAAQPEPPRSWWCEFSRFAAYLLPHLPTLYHGNHNYPYWRKQTSNVCEQSTMILLRFLVNTTMIYICSNDRVISSFILRQYSNLQNILCWHCCMKSTT